jgi:peptidylprolyl isomerase
MAQAKNGDTVRLHYTGRLDDGTVFDTSENRQALQFTVGEGRVIPGFERAVLGMSVGESKSVRIAAADAYGPRRDELVVEVNRSQLPDNLDPQTGQVFRLSLKDGLSVDARVAATTEDSVTLDANHPLAGESLNFELQLLEIVA